MSHVVEMLATWSGEAGHMLPGKVYRVPKTQAKQLIEAGYARKPVRAVDQIDHMSRPEEDE